MSVWFGGFDKITYLCKKIKISCYLSIERKENKSYYC